MAAVFGLSTQDMAQSMMSPGGDGVVGRRAWQGGDWP
jgi:hypothetical protein